METKTRKPRTVKPQPAVLKGFKASVTKALKASHALEKANAALEKAVRDHRAVVLLKSADAVAAWTDVATCAKANADVASELLKKVNIDLAPASVSE